MRDRQIILIYSAFFPLYVCVCVLFKRIEVVLMSVAKAIFEYFNGKKKSFRNIQVNICYEYDIKSLPNLCYADNGSI